MEITTSGQPKWFYFDVARFFFFSVPPSMVIALIPDLAPGRDRDWANWYQRLSLSGVYCLPSQKQT